MGHDDDYDYDRLQDDHQHLEDDDSFDTPKDKFLGVWLVTMCLGATTLMPFNVIITAVDFFSSLYGNSFSFIINFSINLPVIFVMMLLLKFGDRFSLRMRIIWPLFGDCIVLTLIPIIAICFPVSVSYPLVIIASMFAGVFSGILTGSVCGYSAIIGSKYLNATMTGIGIGALGVGILRIITKASLSFAANGNTISCVIYFMLSVVFCWSSAVMFFWMERQPFTRLHFERPHIKDSRSEDAPLIDSDEYNFDSMSEMPVESSKSQMMTVIKQTKIEALMVFLVFSVTLSLFPGITSIITSTMIDNGWFQVIMVFLFQVFDFIGRFGSGFFTLPKIVVRAGVVARLIYVPLFLLAVLTSWFHDDSISYFLMITFALSNGIFGTLTMMQAPSQVDDSLRELCGTYMSFVLQLGVIAGATMGIFFGAGTEVLFKHLHPYGD